MLFFVWSARRPYKNNSTAVLSATWTRLWCAHVPVYLNTDRHASVMGWKRALHGCVATPILGILGILSHRLIHSSTTAFYLRTYADGGDISFSMVFLPAERAKNTIERYLPLCRRRKSTVCVSPIPYSILGILPIVSSIPLPRLLSFAPSSRSLPVCRENTTRQHDLTPIAA